MPGASAILGKSPTGCNATQTQLKSSLKYLYTVNYEQVGTAAFWFPSAASRVSARISDCKSWTKYIFLTKYLALVFQQLTRFWQRIAPHLQAQTYATGLELVVTRSVEYSLYSVE